MKIKYPDLLVYVDGKFIPEVNVFNIIEPDGLFESLIFKEGKIFKLEEHLQRLYDGAKVIKIPLDKDKLILAIHQTIKKNNLTNGYIRISVFKSSLQIIVRPLPQYPEEIYTQGVSIITVPTRRHFIESTNPLVKSSNFAANIMAKIEVTSHFEAIMFNKNGYVTEGTISNIFVCKKGKLVTPPIYLGLLRGITRDFIIELAQKEQIEVKEETITRFDLYCCDEVFLTFTSAGIVPVIQIDGRIIGNGHPGILTQKLRSLLH
ncbi:MAG: aminotransferase class IV [bacterium]